MFGFLKKLFGAAPAAPTEVAYKVEAPVKDYADIALAQLPAGGAAELPLVQLGPEPVPAKQVTATTVKKGPRVKKAVATKKPRAPRKPKASK
jgi:hypothetical protein